MPAAGRRRGRRRKGALLLLLLLLLLLPLSTWLPGLLPGGGRRPKPAPDAPGARPEGTLEVTVVRAEDRTPVDRAVVQVTGFHGGIREFATGPDGRALLEGLPDGAVRIEASAEGKEDARWARPADGPVTLAVEPPGRIEGAVHGAEAATICLLDERGAPLGEPAEGARYAFPRNPRAVAVAAFAPGCAPAVAHVGGDLALGPGEERRGRVLGARGTDLQVWIEAPAPNGDDFLLVRTGWAVDADGAWTARVPPGARLHALADGRPVRLDGESVLPEARRATGRVFDEDGNGVPYAVLAFRPFGTPLPALRVEADAEGDFDAGGFAAVEYAVRVSARGRATRTLGPLVPGDAPLAAVLPPGFAVHGRVTDDQGFPISGATVRGVGRPDPDADRPEAEATTDALGRFALTGLGGEAARVHVSAPSYRRTTADAAPGSTLTISLQPR